MRSVLAQIAKHPLFSIFLLYFVAYGIILINPVTAWDDWTIYNMDFDGLYAQYSQNGFPFYAYLHSFLMSLSSNHLFTYNILIFLLYFISATLIYFTLPYFKLSKNNSYIITLIIAILPFNFARIYMICFPYTLSYFLCFLGLYLFVRYNSNRNIFYRLISLILFLFSMLMNSMLVFIPALIGTFVLIRNYDSIINLHAIKNKIFHTVKSFIKLADFFLLPILYWVIKMQYFKPLGNYSDYNQVKLSGLLDSPTCLKQTIVASLIDLPLFSVSKISNLYALIFFIIVAIAAFALMKKVVSKNNFEDLLKIKTFKIKLFFLST